MSRVLVALCADGGGRRGDSGVRRRETVPIRIRVPAMRGVRGGGLTRSCPIATRRWEYGAPLQAALDRW